MCFETWNSTRVRNTSSFRLLLYVYTMAVFTQMFVRQVGVAGFHALVAAHHDGDVSVVQYVVADAADERPSHLAHAPRAHDDQRGVLRLGSLHHRLAHFPSHLFHLTTEL